jgi:16S rRNA (guanine966-N2)-methyltransferase
MRILGGHLRGRRFSGKIPDNVRPTTDATKEAIFNVLNNYIDFEEIVIADICSGSGALGIEAMSRGGAYCYFFEKNRKTIFLLEEILAYFNISDDYYDIISGDAVKNLSQLDNVLKNKIDLAIMDPPYDLKLCNEIIRALIKHESLSEGAIIIAEHNTLETIEENENIEFLSTKVYGSTVVDFLRYIK